MDEQVSNPNTAVSISADKINIAGGIMGTPVIRDDTVFISQNRIGNVYSNRYIRPAQPMPSIDWSKYVQSFESLKKMIPAPQESEKAKKAREELLQQFSPEALRDAVMCKGPLADMWIDQPHVLLHKLADALEKLRQA